MKKTVAVALSGGLDSSVAALLLKQDNYQVIGLHLYTGFDADTHPSAPARRVAEQIGIEFRSVDCRHSFREAVVDYFIASYAEGKTPSPCVVCNRRIKFDILLNEARSVGASALATGHYARIGKAPDGRLLLLKGIDQGKDQSYFLCRLTQAHLKRALFPLGGYEKVRVQAMADAAGLVSSNSRESQELCFVNTHTYKDFLSRYGNLAARPGSIVNLAGDVLGRHEGLHGYTIGQRRGIGVPGPEPYYVIGMDMRENKLVVGSKSALRSRRCTVANINWIGMKPPTGPVWARTRLRYRHSEAGSVLFPRESGPVRVVFARSQKAVTPGQAAVFYQGNKVLGGGWIV